MISLNVKPYCDGCDYFEPEKSSVIYADNSSYMVEVMCENRRKCDRIEVYLRREMEKEDNSSYEN